MQRRFTVFNTIGASQEQLDAMNKEFEELAGGVHNDDLKDRAAEMVVNDHGGRWNGSWKPIFGED